MAYKGSTNQVLAVECDSPGVMFRNGTFQPEKRYKLFTDSVLRQVVLKRLAQQLVLTEASAKSPHVTLCLAAGKIAGASDLMGLQRLFTLRRWLLFDATWIRKQLLLASQRGYENDIAFVVSKLLLRGREIDSLTAGSLP